MRVNCREQIGCHSPSTQTCRRPAELLASLPVNLSSPYNPAPPVAKGGGEHQYITLSGSSLWNKQRDCLFTELQELLRRRIYCAVTRISSTLGGCLHTYVHACLNFHHNGGKPQSAMNGLLKHPSWHLKEAAPYASLSLTLQ